MGERTIAEASSSFGCLVFFMRHFAVHTARAIGLFVKVLRLSGHGDVNESFKRLGSLEMCVRPTGKSNSLILTNYLLGVDVSDNGEDK